MDDYFATLIFPNYNEVNFTVTDIGGFLDRFEKGSLFFAAIRTALRAQPRSKIQYSVEPQKKNHDPADTAIGYCEIIERLT
jgi:hypothetical protein